MKTAYSIYQDALDAFLVCQDPIKVTRSVTLESYDPLMSPSELFEASGEGAEEDDVGDTDETVELDDSNATEDADADASDDSVVTVSDDTADDTGLTDDGTADAVPAEDTSVAADIPADASTATAGDVNGDGSDEPTSVSATQLLAELTEGDDNIYTRVANAAKERGSNEIAMKDLLPIIAMAIKKFMANRNYASLSKPAMKAMVMNIAKTMAHPPKPADAQDEDTEEA